jgi:2-methylcitrate dehydratase PrpD
VEDLGVVFELMKTAVKPYPSCRYGHAGIDAMLALRAEHKFKPEEIEGITYGTSRSGMILVGEPREKRIDPQNVVDGQFSGPFVLATALATGAMGWDSYAELQNPVIRALLPKVMCEDDPEIEKEFPANMSGKVTVRARGQVFVKTVVVPKGEPDNFLSEAELKAKFAGLVDSVLGVERSAALANAALAIDTCNDVGSLARMSVPAD